MNLKRILMSSTIALSAVISMAPVMAEGPETPAVIESGIAVKDETSPTGYTAKFAFDPASDTSGKEIAMVEVNGTFQYLDPALSVLDENNRIIPDEWKNGAYASNSAPGYGTTGYAKEMTYNEETGLYETSFPIASGSYGYSFRITYTDGTQLAKMEDPSNPANANGKMNFADKRHSSDINSSILYGHYDAEKQSESPDMDFVLPSENYGKLEYVEYTAADDKPNYIGVYTPAGYDPEREEPYKTIYMSHGGGGDEADWFHMGNADYVLQNTIDAGLTQDAIIVTMDNMYFGFDPTGFITGRYQGFDREVVEDNILNHIMPLIEENYNVSSYKGDRAYIGLSFGGRSAADMYWDYPEEFGYFGMLSCGSWVTDADGNNIHEWIDAYGEPELFVSVGEADFCNAEIATPDTFPSMLPQPFAAWCKENIPDNYHESDYGLKVPGSHDWFMWSISFETMLREVLWINDAEYTEGVVAAEEANEDGTYNVTFTVKAPEGTEAVAVAGNMQFYKEEQLNDYLGQEVDDNAMNGDEFTVEGYDAFHYEEGMFTTGYLLDSAVNGRTTNGGIEYEMKEIAENVYQVTLPLPAGMYYYDYILTDGEGTKKAVVDPENKPLENPLNGNTCGHSLFWVGTAEESLPNDAYSFPRTDGKTGTTEFVSYTGADGTEMTMGIYLPYGYSEENEYPVLYLSHGGGGNEADWMSIGAAQNIFDNAIANGEVEPTIVVTMNNTVTGFFNGNSVENIVDAVIPYMEKNYSVIKDRSGRAMAGLSAGGGTTVGALMNANDVFDYYGVWSPSVMPFTAETTDDADVAADLADPECYYVSVGAFDMYIRRDNDKMLADELAEIGADVTFDYKNGTHDWSVWRAQLTTFATDYLWTVKPEAGLTVSEDVKRNGTYDVTFTFDANEVEGEVVNVQLEGGFQFVDVEDAKKYAEQGGSAAGIKWYTAYEYREGMYPTGAAGNKEREDLNYNGSYVLYDMDETRGVYTVTLSLPATEYFYGYVVTFADGTTKVFMDPTNMPIANEQSGNDPHWSYFFVGNAVTAYDQQKAIYPDEEKTGTWSYVAYPASDGTEQPLAIYVPYGYDAKAAEPYKVLYLAHGGGGNETEWMQLGAAANIFDELIAKGEVEPTIVVAMNNSHWPGGFTCESNKPIADELVNYIIPFMEKNYNVSKEASGRAYVGLSAGGVATATVMQYYPEMLDYYGIISATNKRDDLTKEEIDLIKTKTIYVGCGTVDFGMTGSMLSVDVITKMFDEQGIPYGYEVVNGAHDWNTWRAALTTFARDYLWETDETPEDKPEPVKPEDDKKPTTGVNTGDTFNGGILGGMMAGFAALAAAAYFALRNRK